ncbi:MAG: nucleotidyl transferase AbiEii/AbiGii toxin family protein [Chloroflexi bacterium]|nr:nucleotidyl transferase AbiEii/AbiGii toxin family protein [Chloroflexota bacterium]
MITADAIKKMAIAQQTTELNIAREYAQHLFLSGFYQQRGTQQVMFKGGTALRIVYNSPRFSEDLDFSGFGVRVSEIEDWVAGASEGIEQAGIAVSIEESKKTSGGYLGILDLEFSGYQVRVLFEISLRRKNGLRGRGVLVASDFVPAYTVTLLPEEALVEEKLAALLDRGKPRDTCTCVRCKCFFDCYFMLRKNMITPKQHQVLFKVKQVLAGTRINFKAELGDFLPRSYQPIIGDFKKTLMAELERYG